MANPQVLDGKLVAGLVRSRLSQEIGQWIQKRDRRPGLTVIRVGDDPASQVYVRNKRKACESVGIQAHEMHLPHTATQAEVMAAVDRCNRDSAVHGVLVQLPLPPQVDSHAVLEVLDPAKDVDGLTTTNLGRLMAGQQGLVPCTPQGIMVLLDHYQIGLQGARAVVVGRSRLVGLPLALLLTQAHATVTILHRKSRNSVEIAREADVLVVAAGVQGVVDASWIKPQAVVVDVGMHRGPEGLTGDVAESAASAAAWLTPVPGGVGPLTVAMLLQNTWQAFGAQEGQ